MSKKAQFIIGGAIALVIGMAMTLFGYNKFMSVEKVLTEVATTAPSGAIEATIGILIVVVGGLILMHGFGLLPEDTKGR
jgi:uncharacterized membrane protein YidH (DUF202 family)